jgi:hypothetical protein
MTTEKLLEKLRKIRTHAESAAKIGSQAEAEAFAAMFQKLLLDHKIHASEVEVETQEREEPVGRRDVEWSDHGLPYGARRIAWIEELAHVVSRAYFCRFLVVTGSSRIILVGRRTDTEVAEYMLVTLVRAAERLVRKEYQLFRKANPHSETRGFQVSFMAAFVRRLAQRYSEQRRSAEASSSTALVRVNRAESAVTKWVEDNCRKKASGIGQRTMYNADGAARGRAVADSMSLTASALREGEVLKCGRCGEDIPQDEYRGASNPPLCDRCRRLESARS